MTVNRIYVNDVIKEEKDCNKLCGGKFFPYYIDINTPQQIKHELIYVQIFRKVTFIDKSL